MAAAWPMLRLRPTEQIPWGRLSVIDRLREELCPLPATHFLDAEQLSISRLIPNAGQDSLHRLLRELIHVFDKGRLVHLVVCRGCMATGHGLSPGTL